MTSKARRLMAEAMAAGGSRPLIASAVVVVVTLALLLPSQFERNATVDALNYEHDLNERGYSTLLLSAANPPRDQPTDLACEQFRSLPGVEAAVWLESIPEGSLFSEFGPTVPLWRAGGDVQSLVAASPSDPVGVVIDSGLGVVATDTIRVFVPGSPAGRSPMRAATGDFGRLGASFSGNVFVASPTVGRRVDHCVLLTSTERRANVAASAAALFQDPAELTTSWALLNADDLESPAKRFHERPTRWYWLWAVGGALLVWGGAMRLARSDRALYAVLGLSSRNVWLMMATQWTVVVAAASIASLAAVVARGGEPGFANAVQLETWLRSVIAMYLGGGVLAGVAAVPADIYAILRND